MCALHLHRSWIYSQAFGPSDGAPVHFICPKKIPVPQAVCRWASLLLSLDALASIEKICLPSWVCTAVDCCASNKQRNMSWCMNDWFNLETGLLMVGCNQTASSTVNLKSIKLGWAPSGRLNFAAWIWGESTSPEFCNSLLFCYRLFIVQLFMTPPGVRGLVVNFSLIDRFFFLFR